MMVHVSLGIIDSGGKFRCSYQNIKYFYILTYNSIWRYLKILKPNHKNACTCLCIVALFVMVKTCDNVKVHYWLVVKWIMIHLCYGILMSCEKEYCRSGWIDMETSLKLCISRKSKFQKTFSVIPIGLKFTYVNSCQQFWGQAYQTAKKYVLWDGLEAWRMKEISAFLLQKCFLKNGGLKQ